ncbi:MAG: peptidoglycan editing factor PgeF [Firmicutes bacterium]|nr:peptidoglycan editing factor PgeF [Bacillota bacterium]
MDFNSETLNIHRSSSVYYVTFPSFEKTGLVKHLYSTRRGGVSTGYFGPMNLGFTRGDDRFAVIENFRRISYVTGIYPGDMVFSDQVHGDRILYVDQQDRGKGIYSPKEMRGVDGLITDKSKVCLVTFYADCVPLFFLDPVKKVIGLAHAGWRGTVLEIGRKMVERFCDDFGSQPGDILAGIGPSIGPCCFEVGPDVEGEFAAAFPAWREDIIRPAENPGKSYVDLWKTNRLILEKAGVYPEHITVTDLCTKCHDEYFHSHRRMGNERGTQAAFLELI